MTKDKSKDLIYQVKLVEKWKQAIPTMKPMAELGGAGYIAGTLVLNIPCPLTGNNIMYIDVKPIDDYESKIIREGMYWASKIYVKVKGPSCAFYSLSVDNIEKYEKEERRETVS